MKYSLRIMKILTVISIFILVLFLFSCGGGGGDGGGTTANDENVRPGETITIEQAQEIMDVLSEAGNYYDQLISQGDLNAVPKTVEWFKSQDSVEEAGRAPGTIWVKFKAGEREGAIFTD